ncbi:MAG: hypothetical protein WB902_01300 [Acetobacteraceae bacterium]
MATRTEDGKCRAHVNRRDTRKATASPPLTGGAAALASGDRLFAAYGADNAPSAAFR